MSRFFPWRLLSLVALIFLVAFVAYPIVGILFRSFIGPDGGWTLEGFRIFLWEGRYLDALVNSLILASVVTTLCIFFGGLLAYMVAKYDIPFGNTIFVLPLSVLIIPELISAQAWLMVFGNNGIVTNLFQGWGIPFPRFYGWFGLIYVMTLTYYVHVFLATLAALRGFDRNLAEAGQSLGTSPIATNLKVVFPTVMPAVLSSGLIVFTLVIGNFAVAITLSQNVPLLSVLIYRTFLSELGGNQLMQSTLATISILLVASVFFVQKSYVDRRSYVMTSGRSALRRRIRGVPAFAAAMVAGTLIVLSLLPAAVVLLGSLTYSRGPVAYWGEFTLAHYMRVWNFGFPVVQNSLTFASLATALGVVFATVVSYLLVKRRTTITVPVDYLLLLPLTISGTVLGIALAQTYNTGPVVLTGTTAIMVLAIMIRRLPFTVRNASANLHNISPSLEDASVSLGVPPLRTVLKIVVPLMAPGIIAAAIITWVMTIAELSASVVVYSAGQETLTIQIFRLIRSDLMTQASAYGVVNMVVILVPIIFAVKMMRVKLFSS